MQKNCKDDLNHVLLVHSDPQFYKEEQFNLYEPVIEDCIETISNYKDRDILELIGDLTADNVSFYSPYIEILSRTNVPFYRVLGNHDLKNGDRTKGNSTEQFENVFGLTYYSFNCGKAHYIILNNVFYVGRLHAYMGYIDKITYQ